MKVDPVGNPQDLDPTEPESRLKVSSNGSQVRYFSFPEICGFNRSKAAEVRGMKISDEGKFSGKRRHTERIKAARGGSGGAYDLVRKWTLKVSGRFVSKKKATGKLTMVLKHHLEDQSGENPPGALGDEETCKSPRDTPWRAKA